MSQPCCCWCSCIDWWEQKRWWVALSITVAVAVTLHFVTGHTLLCLLLGLLLPWLKTLLLLTEAYLQHLQHHRLVLKSCRKYSVVYHFAWTWMTCTVYNCIPMSDGWQMTEVSRVYLVNASCDHGLNNPECVYMHDRCHRVLILDTSACDLQRCADALNSLCKLCPHLPTCHHVAECHRCTHLE